MEENKIVETTEEVVEEKKGFFAKIKETKNDLKVKNQELVEKHPAIGYFEKGLKVVTGGAIVVAAYNLGKRSVVTEFQVVPEVVEEVIEEVTEV